MESKVSFFTYQNASGNSRLHTCITKRCCEFGFCEFGAQSAKHCIVGAWWYPSLTHHLPTFHLEGQKRQRRPAQQVVGINQFPLQPTGLSGQGQLALFMQQ